MEQTREEILQNYPALAIYAQKRYQGEHDRRARCFRQAWDFAEEFGGVLQTARESAARRIMAAQLGRSEDPSLLPQHTRTLAFHYKSGDHWFIAFDDDATRENLAWKLCHAYNSPAQFADGWTVPLEDQVYRVLERANERSRILPHPAYDHAVTGTMFKTTLEGGAENFAEQALSAALFGDLALPFAQAHALLARDAIHFHLPRTTDLDAMTTAEKVLIVPVVIGGAFANSPLIHLEKSNAIRGGVDTYLASTLRS